MQYEAMIQQIDDGKVHQVRLGDRSTTLFIPKRLSDHPRVGVKFTALDDAIATTSETLAARAGDLTFNGFLKLATEQVAATLAPAFRAAQASVPVALADLDKREAPFRALRFADDQPPAVRVEQRQHARALPLPKLIEATRADPALAAAIIEGGVAMSGLPAEIFDQLRDDMMVTNASRSLAATNDYRTPASASDPIGGQPDHSAARAAGERLIAAFRAERELLDLAPVTLASVVAVLALRLDTTVDAAFAALTA